MVAEGHVRTFEAAEEQPIALQEILSAMTFALDLTEGAVPGHALRCVLLGMRIAEAMKLPERMLTALYYALQLKDIGCSSNSARVAQMFAGDDRQAKALSKVTDWTTTLRLGGASSREAIADWTGALREIPRHARLLWKLVQPSGGPREKMRQLASLGRNAEKNMREVISLRCDRGAHILGKLEMSPLACEGVRGLDERWDGSGYPNRLSGQQIPLISRICAVAQYLDVLAVSSGPDAAIRGLLRRKGIWFDPEVVRVAQHLHRRGGLWTDCEPGCSVNRTRTIAMEMSPEAAIALPADRIDAISAAFADVVDAKSPFTFRHSMGVMQTAVPLAEELGYPWERVRVIRRAALLHDLGKLGVPNTILDKPSPLTHKERLVVFQHPSLSRAILERVSGFREIAKVAGEHHERLDGGGYPWGLRAEQLSCESRLLAVADVFATLAEERPYRAALPLDEVMVVLSREARQRLDPMIVDAFKGVLERWQGVLPSAFTGEHMNFCEPPVPLAEIN